MRPPRALPAGRLGAHLGALISVGLPNGFKKAHGQGTSTRPGAGGKPMTVLVPMAV